MAKRPYRSTSRVLWVKATRGKAPRTAGSGRAPERYVGTRYRCGTSSVWLRRCRSSMALGSVPDHLGMLLPHQLSRHCQHSLVHRCVRVRLLKSGVTSKACLHQNYELGLSLQTLLPTGTIQSYLYPGSHIGGRTTPSVLPSRSSPEWDLKPSSSRQSRTITQ